MNIKKIRQLLKNIEFLVVRLEYADTEELRASIKKELYKLNNELEDIINI